MTNEIDLGIIEKYLMDKIAQNEDFVVCSFFEIRVKLDISEDQETEFLRFAKIRLENLGYDVYFTGAKYTYQNEERVVQDNELIVAIKNQQ